MPSITSTRIDLVNAGFVIRVIELDSLYIEVVTLI